ncbi:hypothetical protein KC19_4G004400 [Ceratodon purpureus]|uniref:Uncharacterized protein n=1 Tax=Ceratodon purpureus TaxID=3225 RepID=A0A8T0I3V6_CERPU|nr:hypothetical protein KC19_4G004400 [Ceratodon purpureus]
MFSLSLSLFPHSFRLWLSLTLGYVPFPSLRLPLSPLCLLTSPLLFFCPSSLRKVPHLCNPTPLLFLHFSLLPSGSLLFFCPCPCPPPPSHAFMYPSSPLLSSPLLCGFMFASFSCVFTLFPHSFLFNPFFKTKLARASFPPSCPSPTALYSFMRLLPHPFLDSNLVPRMLSLTWSSEATGLLLD